MTDELPSQPLLQHLIELKRRLIICIITYAIATTLCYMVAQPIYAFLVQPLAEAFPNPEHRRLIYTGLTEAFVTPEAGGFRRIFHFISCNCLTVLPVHGSGFI